MIRNAKVSMSAVNTFKKSVIRARDYSSKFTRGTDCIQGIIEYLKSCINKMEISVNEMKASLDRLAVIIKEIHAAIAKLEAEKRPLELHLNMLEAELAATPPEYDIVTEDGSTITVANPAYQILLNQIAEVERQIDVIDRQIHQHQQRLDRAYTAQGKLNQHVTTAEGVTASLREKINTCSRLKEELQETCAKNLKKGTGAAESLQKIEQIIENYRHIKMKYNDASVSETTTGAGNNTSININVSVNTSERVTETVLIQKIKQQLLEKKQEAADFKEKIVHRIKYDENGRICEYEGRTYGGKYKSYEARLDRSSKNDPMRGHYEGVRGESKYIPTDRTAEGVKVIGILKQYDMDGIVYRNAEPDFEVCSYAVVQISGMTENREDYKDSDGNTLPGNFSQADIELARIWNNQRRSGKDDWTDEDVKNYRTANRLTWHEKCDTKTMVLVRREINEYFKHSGGCAECRERDGGVNAEDEFDE